MAEEEGASIGLTDKQIAEAKEAFNFFDRDGNGAITVAELGTALRSLGQIASDSEVEAMVTDLDADGTGMLEFPEFLSCVAKRVKANETPEAFIRSFQVFDPDGKGFVSVSEFRHIFAELGDEPVDSDTVEEFIKYADINADGQINYEALVQNIMTAEV